MPLLAFWRRLWISPVAVYADFIDPFCYIGVTAFLRALAAAPRALDWRGFEFNPGTPEEGWPLDTAGNSDLRPGMWASVRAYAQSNALSFPEPRFISNTRKAHRLVRAASSEDVKKSLIERIYQSYFKDQKDIGRVDVLSSLTQGLAMTSKQLDSAFATETSKLKQPDRFREEAKHHRFTGMPGFAIGGQTYFGAITTDRWHTILEPKRKETTHV